MDACGEIVATVFGSHLVFGARAAVEEVPSTVVLKGCFIFWELVRALPG